ncbi:MAG TPA: histidinol-phosphate transaminase [Casimicrobiaceae bacterium]|nr:histidinol-phosphate transaminase [Casimicrobiaceae bacterium]
MNAPRTPALTADPRDVAARVSAVVRSEVRALTAYQVAKADGMIKLDANESPYALPETCRAQLGAALAAVPLNRYPDGGADAVKAAIRKAHALPDDVGVVLGNGSDELLQLITTTVVKPGAAIVAPDPTFVMYRLYATYAGARYVPVALRPDFALDTDAMLAAIAREQPALVWLASPNNPTATQFDAHGVERIVRAAPGLAVVDEAYFAFASHTFLPRVLEFPNLVVVRTLSKIGMAGLRLGYAVSHRAWTEEIDKVRSPYNLNSLTQAAAQFLLADDAVFTEHAAAIRAERTRLMTALARFAGVTVFDSAANFFVARFPDGSATFAKLKNAGILVKNVHGWHPLLANCLPITVGTEAENDALLAALGQPA